jgi:hypothetical protein
MPRSVYFSFHYEDVSSFRANVVRNSWVTQRHGSESFVDRSIWEEARQKGSKALKRLIDTALEGTSVTAILVGSGTHSRRWVKYEIVKSFTEGKGILPIYINRIPSRKEGIIARGINPLSQLAIGVDENCRTLTFYERRQGKWQLFEDLPYDNNRTTNSIYFGSAAYGNFKGGKRYVLSDLFENDYDWVLDEGYQNFADWIEEAAEEVGR